MKLREKIAAAKAQIGATKLKKEGRNKFSEYDYFTPGQIEKLVEQVCNTNKLLTKFDLKRNELGVYGELTIYDLESEDFLVYTMASAIPEIKATNIAQQLGGCVTYTERYLKTSAFGITDNNLDFDVTPKPETKTNPAPAAPKTLEEGKKIVEESMALTWINKGTPAWRSFVADMAVEVLKGGDLATAVRLYRTEYKQSIARKDFPQLEADVAAYNMKGGANV